MEKLEIKHSLKDIPIPNEKKYLLSLTTKIEDLISRMRWKAFWHSSERKDEMKKNDENFGFKSQRSPPHCKQLEAFELDLLDIVNRIKFSNRISKHQKSLKELIGTINNSKKVLVKADKTNNFYQIEKMDYQKMLNEEVTKTYKKVVSINTSKEEIINNDAKRITADLKISDRVPQIIKKDAYFLVKDHKQQFPSKIEKRLINPTRTEVGKISKVILERINGEIKNKLHLQQWISTGDAIDWFNRIVDKRNSTFVQFDIVNFYPSINKKTFMRALTFAKEHSAVTDREIDIILHCRKTLLITGDDQWTSKDTEDFTISMGSLDSAQASDLVGLHILFKLSALVLIKNIGLYRDDGLLVINNSTPRKSDKIMKFVYKIFKEFELKVEVLANLKIVNFLDTKFNLSENTYEPYKKDNTTLRYVHVNSNHPACVIKQIPESVNSRLNFNSSNMNVFENHINDYEVALMKSGYNEKLEYKGEKAVKSRKRKKKNVMWFTPPFNIQVKTNVGRMFLKLIDKHFPKNSMLASVFNRTNLKISYSCTENLERIVKKHNNKILNSKPVNTTKKDCNCRKKTNCPLQGCCRVKSVVYKATIMPKDKPDDKKFYIGVAKTDIKARIANHNQCFRDFDKRNSTALSAEFWKMKNKQLNPQVSWEVIAKAGTPRSLTENCQLCTRERFEILKFEDIPSLLNRRNEIATICVHQRDFSLLNYDNK